MTIVTISQIFIFRTPDQREKTTANATSLATMKESGGATKDTTDKQSEKESSSSSESEA